MCINKNEVTNYENLNKFANKNSVVVLGSTFMHDVPMAELRQSFGIHADVYNRSLTDLKVSEAKDIVEGIMQDLNPKRILLQLGEVEMNEPATNVANLMKDYKTIIATIRRLNKKCKIVVVSINDTEDNIRRDFYNKSLEELCTSEKCQFADISVGKKSESSQINAFMNLKFFLTDDVADALSFAI